MYWENIESEGFHGEVPLYRDENLEVISNTDVLPIVDHYYLPVFIPK